MFRESERQHRAPSRTKFTVVDLGAATVCIPLVASGTLVGGLYLFWKDKQSFCEDESAFAATLAGLCSVPRRLHTDA